MQRRTAARAASTALLIAMVAGEVAQAQPYDPRYYQPGQYGQDPRYRPAPHRGPVPGYPGYYPGKLVQPAPEQQPGFSLRRLFGLEDPQPPVVQPDPYPYPRHRASPRPRVRPPAPAVAARPEKPKVDPSTIVVVFGDALADAMGQGLDEAFGESQDVGVIRKARADMSLSRQDSQDWTKTIQDTLNSTPKAAVAVVMLGPNDRQAIRDGDTMQEPLSDRWRALYRDRVDAVARAFKERGIPLVWVGEPPAKNERLSADLISINEIVRDRVQEGGGVYVDIWPGFVDEENRYTATGPDVNGQPARLRAGDGVSFTRAGARKAAHFASVEIRRLIEAKQSGAGIAAVPGSPEAPATDQMINAALPAPPDLPGAPPLAAKPVAGPVLPLTKQDVAPGGTLTSGQPRLDGDAYVSRRVLRDGLAPSPRPGRADDFRWPRS